VWAVFPTGIQNCRYDFRVTVEYIISGLEQGYII